MTIGLYAFGQQIDTLANLEKISKDSSKQIEEATFPGGNLALNDFLNKNLQLPDSSEFDGKDVKVYVRVMINKTGEIEEAVVMKPVDPYLDKEAIRLIKLMPVWNPAKENGQAINTWMILPLKFKRF
jgi:protein TonB